MSKLTLGGLIREMHNEFENAKPDLYKIQKIMESYCSIDSEWQKYAFGEKQEIIATTASYTRHLVDSGNGNFNLMILVWKKSHGSSIHAHSNSNCLMKLLEGRLKESRYEWPKSKTEQMTLLSETYLKENEVSYITDEIGLHRVENPSHTDIAVSLHLYWPPFDSAKVFDENTGKDFITPMTFHTIYKGQDSIVLNESAVIVPESN